jgi:hypothetical protein
MEILAKILGSEARVKIMRLFLVNKNKTFQNKDIAAKSRVNPSIMRRELSVLKSAGFIKKIAAGFAFNPAFKYADELENLLISTDSIDRDSIANNFKKAGKVKLIAISGRFLKDKDSRVDILVVGDKLKRGRIDDQIRKLEAEVGAELSYAVFETKEFLYRLNMYDKLVRDILDFPHEVLWETKELSTEALKKP